VDRLHRSLKGSPYQANRAIAVLSRLFTLAMKWGLRTDNPVKGVERNHEQKRSRYLTAEELSRLSEALAARGERRSANAVRLLLLTVARKGEVLSMRWEDLDLSAGAVHSQRGGREGFGGAIH
jgi:integrase